MVTVFKSINNTSTPYLLNIQEVLERIKNGRSREIVEQVRSIQDKHERNEVKKKLPAICFSGEFTRREAKGLEKHSGYICLDFDGFKSEEDLIAKRKWIEEDQYTFACFLSPSGDGLKVIVQIPADADKHKEYFLALERYYNCPEFDKSTKDVSRVCYESYDPTLFVNEFSATWHRLPDVEKKQYHVSENKATIRVDEDDKIIQHLLKWWEREYGLVEGARNNNLFVLCAAMNEFGIPKMMCKVVCSRFEAPDFTAEEISTTIDSAYNNISAHGTKFFEDTDTIDQIRRDVKMGKSVDDIVSSVKADANVVRQVIQQYKELSTDDEFWTVSSKGGVQSVHHLFKKFLQDAGFYKYYHAGSDKFIFVRIQSNLIDDVTEDRIKEYVLGYLDTLENKMIYNYFADKTKLFKEDFLSLLDPIDIKFATDTKEKSYIYFRNCAVKVTQGTIEKVDYIDLDGFVWKKQIISRNFEPNETTDCDYKRFIACVGGDDESVKSIESTIGYLCHGFKPASYCPAVIINDEKISENPEGGTGKGIFIDAISKIRRSVILDGKEFRFDKSFAYQTVTVDTQVLVYDDVIKNFDFERLFSIITQGITLEKKNKDAIKVPFEMSPKIVITTNYAIRGSGNSNERRKWELEFKQYFNRFHTPEDEFGRILFSDWDVEEWNRFDNYMISCIQLYLNDGLVKTQFKNIKARKLIADTSFDFYEWANGADNINMRTAGIRLQAKDLYEAFTNDYKDYGRYGKYTLPEQKFNTWLQKWAVFRFKNEAQTGRSATGKWIQFNTPDEIQQELGF